MGIERQNTEYSLPMARGFILNEDNADLVTIRQPSPNPPQESLEEREIDVICRRYAGDTWSGLTRMSQTPTGYPEDMVWLNGKERSNSKTSPTNIGLFLASTIAARDMDLISPSESDQSVGSVLVSLEEAKKYQGLFYNWYDTQTGDTAEQTDRPFISTVDNAWLTAGLMTIQAASSPGNSERARKIIEQMKASFLYDWERNLFYGGYYPDSQEPTKWHYDILNTEARIASYVWTGTGEDKIPLVNYNRLGRFAPADSEIKRQNCHQFLSWGGSMFEALMPTLFVPEQEWSHTWESNHREYINTQIQHGKRHHNGFWGISPCYNGTYHEAGLAELAIKEGGYGVTDDIAPHASFLSLLLEPDQAMENLQRLERVYPALYENGYGFSDSVNTQTGEVSQAYLLLDQSMSLIAVFNYLSENKIPGYISPQLKTVKSLISSLDDPLPITALHF